MSISIKKAIIPVAGLGTRMLPATKAIPKEMLPLVDKPMIQYVVNECIRAGINEIILVTHSSKNSIENHFDNNFELENISDKHLKRQLLSEVRSICPKNVTIIQVRQGLPKGLGHAILCAYPLVNNEPFVVVLPDVILEEYNTKINTDNLSKMIERYKETKYSQIMVEPVPIKYVSNYGIIDCNIISLQSGKSTPIKAVVEKPTYDKAPSNMSIVGRYVFSPKIWLCLSKIPLGIDKEIQLTDAIDMLIQEEVVEAHLLKGLSYDCGNKMGYIQAFVRKCMHHPSLGKEFTTWLKSLNYYAD
ncbi:UTP--glucose-1-phosphate uridylyltransferase GalU [Candidatus Profftia sp. (ex Adelges kitamiensis)]|uniref:UTP--glucose-1-phosphate uridylyltransferase GalU n=1 Tax=Candidatus Profftia sp. (ex Adelges kitamiensis) TaxID=2864218 RepID=UPI001CE2D6B1|nr:UTP--glucose-1-phosphate uridylyltransferase GalU [Candidatus Profftia sp. (ex Adelges kitamiensis)]